MNPLLTPAHTAPRPFHLTGDEWLAICRELEQHHAVFYKLWEIGMPVFSDKVETAAVYFDRGGDFVRFLFNPDYWQSCPGYERLFVICHEALHLLLNHGARTRDATDQEATNIALDVVVNHLLVRSFGFERDRIRNWRDLCWIETVFPGRPVPDDECFEYYLGLMGTPPASPGESADTSGVRTVDDHAGLGEADRDGVIRRLDEGLSSGEKRDFEALFDSLFKKTGDAPGGLWHVAKAEAVKPNRKWETVIRKWVRKKVQESSKGEEQWARLNRRFHTLSQDMFLPTEVEAEGPEEKKGRMKVRFYLDTSGSCWQLKDRFFTAALSIPKDRFDVELFCFDTQVVATDLDARRLCGGGGTSFRIIEEDIQRATARDRAEGGQGEYPDAVFVMTDGWGDAVRPSMPRRWYWFIDGASEYDIKGVVGNRLPAECNVFDLADFQ